MLTVPVACVAEFCMVYVCVRMYICVCARARDCVPVCVCHLLCQTPGSVVCMFNEHGFAGEVAPFVQGLITALGGDLHSYNHMANRAMPPEAGDGEGCVCLCVQALLLGCCESKGVRSAGACFFVAEETSVHVCVCRVCACARERVCVE